MDTLIEEIVAVVLRDNLDKLKVQPNVYQKVMNKYGSLFFEAFANKPDVTYGLQIGLTKHFLEFVINRLSLISKITDTELDNIFKLVLSPAIKVITDTTENNIAVYVLYRILKTTIDDEINEKFPIKSETSL